MTGTPAIRPATKADDDAIWAMLEPVFRAGETYAVDPGIPREAGLAYWSGGDHRVFVAEDAGAPFGSYFLTPNQKGGGAHVCNCGFVTDQAARGRGIARAMLRHALKVAREAGFAAMQFNFVIASNHDAVALWHSEGFETIGRLPAAFRHPRQGLVDALVMFRQL